MRAVWMGMVAASALLMVGTAQANADLAKANGCTNCHTVDKKLVGPALKDIAAKYKDDPKAEAYLADKIKKGSNGVWGPVPMPPNAQVSDANAKVLAAWVLTLK
ncbi:MULTISPECIES: c-type cytochrome [unclassified Nitrosospira]|jgi:cytochrome c|uniref:c-type cytochrome n=1 Tax=unclassified Nitrosospira TaxID=2609267 RepID=UPI000D31FA1D|nr:MULTISPECIES: c-type cytochrome [unclassified Nitrosospira]PTR15556.1 cytochrome c [Nitrosospira sp. Nsp2]WON75008.1 c-type cytochrome [Nitrosospira sp. Is2]